jgi:hypothetical protein
MQSVAGYSYPKIKKEMVAAWHPRLDWPLLSVLF